MANADPHPLLRVKALRKTYAQKRWPGRSVRPVIALDGVDLTLARGKSLVVTGESGSGKSTLARCLVRLEEPDSGEIRYDGCNLLELRGTEFRTLRRKIQLVFQDSAGALNPRFTAAEIVGEPLAIACGVFKRERRERALALLEQTGLPRSTADRAPEEFSGGQRQRLAIARALAAEPELLILDEALSALDLPIQAQIVNLLLDLQKARGLTYLWITHDLSLAEHLAGEVAVLFGGKIVERAAPRTLLRQPVHPHTRALVAAIPRVPMSLERG